MNSHEKVMNFHILNIVATLNYVVNQKQKMQLSFEMPLFTCLFSNFFIYSLYQSYNDVREKQKFKIEGTTVQQIKARKVTITIFIC